MKKFIAVFIGVALALLCATPALAAGFSLSPAEVEFDVPADGSKTVEFLVYDFGGDFNISLEDIPLRVEPERVSVAASEEGTPIELTFYGDESLGSEVFNGNILFLASSGGNIAFGVKVIATVNHIAAGEPLPQTTPQESPPPEAPPPAPPGPPGPPPAPEGTTGGLSPNTVMFIFIGLLCLAVLAMAIQAIRVLARRRQH